MSAIQSTISPVSPPRSWSKVYSGTSPSRAISSGVIGGGSRIPIERSTEAAETHLQARIELDAIARDLQMAALDPASPWHERLRTNQVLALHRAGEAEQLALGVDA